MKRFKIAVNSLRGRSHEINGTPCQDNNFYEKRKGTIIMSLGDGAGSRELSHYGSKTITKEICKVIGKDFKKIYHLKIDEAKSYIITRLWNSLLKVSKKEKISMEELKSTLIFIGIKNSKIIAGHLGDGIIGFRHKDELKILSKSEEREYSNHTYFLSKNSHNKLNLFKGNLEEIDSFFAFTDGCDSFLYNKKYDQINPKLNELLDGLEKHSEKKIKKIMSSSIEECINNKITFDDCSLGIIKIISDKKNFKGEKNGFNRTRVKRIGRKYFRIKN